MWCMFDMNKNIATGKLLDFMDKKINIELQIYKHLALPLFKHVAIV